MPKIKSGGIFEIKLVDKYYVYVCEVREYHFFLFDFISEKPVEGIEIFEKIKFKAAKNCKRDGIRIKAWKLIGIMDLIKNNIKAPDVAVYVPWWDNESNYKRRTLMRNGLMEIVTLEEYKKTLETGITTGWYETFKGFENYLIVNLDNILNNKPMKDEWDISGGIKYANKMPYEKE
jgi:hypothetical protein